MRSGFVCFLIFLKTKQYYVSNILLFPENQRLLWVHGNRVNCGFPWCNALSWIFLYSLGPLRAEAGLPRSSKEPVARRVSKSTAGAEPPEASGGGQRGVSEESRLLGPGKNWLTGRWWFMRMSGARDLGGAISRNALCPQDSEFGFGSRRRECRSVGTRQLGSCWTSS